ncbi:Transmembrane protein [Quillaja saponaria]|uniref:Transmembrane protein n=1 Tax=Quillaja saponaria TaxID=32244 RepID=A0AAD7PTY5_QUISA|nr:Transmembrane protein [Quillaja saponaria]
MDIPKKFLQYRYQLTIAVAVPLFFSLLLYSAPRIVTILAYFWPLFASTTVFLIAIIVFGGVAQLSTETHGEKAGKRLLDYVAAGRPEHTEEHQNFE